MIYELIIPPKVKKILDKLNYNMKEKILKSLERIRIRPYDYLERLTNSPYYKLRTGDYRAIIDIQDNKLIIYVVKVGHRKNVYDNL